MSIKSTSPLRMHGWIRKSRIAQEYPGSRSGTIRGLFGCLTTRHQHGYARHQDTINTTVTRTVPDSPGSATDQHDRDTHTHG
ncbi:hypothetical protein DPMN_159068 [Dreissena polymorpha]|uniref:Uncharacterized protein n=1 Tax=Dreissena polymorpha TaxID=45954 RepID=A0A9D4EL01_DREPO|nr:hypothetical protein DPMN_159068 [Dreissena polymorpha]